MKLRHLVTPILIAGLLVPAVLAIQLPTAPTGYTWKSIDEIQSAFLVPASWHFMEAEAKGTMSYFITRENIDRNGGFETGMTVHVVRKGKEFDAVGAAGAFVLKAVQDNEVLEQPFEAGGGKLRGYGCRVRVRSEAGALIMHYLVIGNEETGTMFVILFESPEAEWERAWAIAEPMVTLFILGDEA